MLRAIVREATQAVDQERAGVCSTRGAAGVLDNWSFLWKTVLAFVAFCLESSGTYYWNDIHDVEADRQHPTKRNRPIASGAPSRCPWLAVGTALLACGIGLSFGLNWQLGVVTTGYVVLNTTYSTVLKHVAWWSIWWPWRRGSCCGPSPVPWSPM